MKCLLCQHSTLSVVAERESFTVTKCNDCRLLMGNDNTLVTDDDGAINTAPSHFHMLVHQGDVWHDVMGEILKNRIAILEKKAGFALNNWLEIGPGNGGMEALLAQYGKYWIGIEIEKDMAKSMIDSGKNVINADFSSIDVDALIPDNVREKGGFDIIFFSQVFEHVTQPVKFLKNAHKSLRPGGILYVDVPNNDGLTAFIRKIGLNKNGYAEIVPPHHMIGYGRETLQFALEQAGFKKVETIAAANNNPIFGLAHAHMDNRLKMKTIWNISHILGMGGNLAAMAIKP